MAGYLAGHDFSPHTSSSDPQRPAESSHAGSVEANREPFTARRVTLRDVTDFRNYLHREQAAGSGQRQSCPRDDPAILRLAGSAGSR